MPKLLINLRGVPEDEADEVCALLDQHGIAHYRVAPGNWGVSGGGIWLNEDADLTRARALHADYQTARAQRAREDYRLARERGETDTFFSLFRRHPLRVSLQLLVILFLIALTTVPFFWIAYG